MKRMLINATQPEELRVALVDGKKLYNFISEHPGHEQKVGNIYKAKITSIEPSLNAVFVDYGGERHGFLPLKEVSKEYFQRQDHDALERRDVKELLKPGQELIIQIEKEERGSKGAAVTTFISLAGSYLVLMPNNPRAGGISRRIEDADERGTLREHLSKLNITEGMGIIIRTAGVNKSLEELQWDLNILLQHWEAIKQAASERAGSFLIHQEGNVVTRSIRDYLTQDINEIIIDNLETFEQAKEFIQLVRPALVERLKFYEENTPLFNRYEIEHQIESAYQRAVNLPSGGSLVVDHAEALVSIDVNSARSTKGADIEETAFNTNLEAAEEIARQLRLRDIGGLIVIDFIDMMAIRHQREVENHLRNALHIDRARVQIGRISRFGLLEMSRQRLTASLRDTIHVICPRCNGQGTIRSVESLALSIIRIIEEDAMKSRTDHIQVQLPVDAATYLVNEKRETIVNLEHKYEITISIIPNPHLQSPNYQIKRGRTRKAGSQSERASYDQVDKPKIEPPLRKTEPRNKTEEPAIKSILPSSTTTPPAASTSTAPTSVPTNTPSLIKRLWKSMFGTTETGDGGSAAANDTAASSKRGYANKRNQSAYRQRSGRYQGNRASGYRKSSSKRKTSTSRQSNPQRSNSRSPRGGSGSSRRNDSSNRSRQRTRRGNRGGNRTSNQGQHTSPQSSHQKNAESMPDSTEQRTTSSALDSNKPKQSISPQEHKQITKIQKPAPDTKNDKKTDDINDQPVIIRPQKDGEN